MLRCLWIYKQWKIPQNYFSYSLFKKIKVNFKEQQQKRTHKKIKLRSKPKCQSKHTKKKICCENNTLTTLLIFFATSLPLLFHVVCNNWANQYNMRISTIERHYKGIEKGLFTCIRRFQVFRGKLYQERIFFWRFFPTVSQPLNEV